MIVADRGRRPSQSLRVPLGGGPAAEIATCVDLLGPTASARWSTALERDTVSVVGTRHGLVREVSGESRLMHEVSPSWDLQLIDLANGTYSHLRTTAPADPPIHTQDLVSPDGLSVLFRASHGGQAATRVGELELPAGRPRWSFDAPWPSRDLWSGAGLALVRRRENGPGALVALDRETGRPRWEAWPGPIEALAVVGEQVVLAAAEEPDVLVLTALSAADGRIVADRRLALGTPISDRRDGRACAVLADDALRFAVAGRDALVVVEVPA